MQLLLLNPTGDDNDNNNNNQPVFFLHFYFSFLSLHVGDKMNTARGSVEKNGPKDIY